LPCVGMGRHVKPLLDAGVRHIVGVDLSPSSVEVARNLWQGDDRVRFEVADLTIWCTSETFDAAFLLGNSFGDIIDEGMAGRFTVGITASVRPGGRVVMDYIGEAYLDRMGHPTVWDAVFNGRQVADYRTTCYDWHTRIMTIEISVQVGDEIVWSGVYQKKIIPDADLECRFSQCGVSIQRHGTARDLSPYHAARTDLGMLAASAWWRGTKS
jgi:hypothetical protein